MVNENNVHVVVDAAIRAGMAAHENARPTPMVLQGSFGGQRYHVAEGACGFAWVNVYGIKGNTKLGKKLKTLGFAKAYEGGLRYWVSTMTQSVDRKEAFAMAMADVLRQNGLEAYADSRLD